VNHQRKREPVSSFLTEGGPAVKLEVGETFEGQVLSITEMDDRDPNGTVKTWDDGSPRKVWVFNVKPADGETQSLWVRGNLVKVLRTAAREAKVANLEGSVIKVQRIEDGVPSTKGYNPPKLYRAKVTPGVLPKPDTFVNAGVADDTDDPF
jgi:hypothetical protein